MRHAHRWTARFVVTAAAAAFVVALGAQTMPKLPEAIELPLDENSPGVVTFNHDTHIDAKQPDCTTCHPSMFRIVPKGSPVARTVVTHERMDKGELCGSCHDGEKAFAMDDDCTYCHRE